MSDYTPGEWLVEPGDSGDDSVGLGPSPTTIFTLVDNGECITICTLHEPTHCVDGPPEDVFDTGRRESGTIAGNADLISAAPELLAACQELDKLDWCIGYELGGESNHVLLDKAVSLARAAIAKATGGPS